MRLSYVAQVDHPSIIEFRNSVLLFKVSEYDFLRGPSAFSEATEEKKR
jgi:hypothetical protein